MDFLRKRLPAQVGKYLAGVHFPAHKEELLGRLERNGVLSVIFLMFVYFGPGIIKSVLTLRTGNAWVHLWAYHAISPHVTVDTPNIVNVFKLG